MKKLIILALVMLGAMGTAQQASAQFHFGVKGGVCINSLKFNEKTFAGDNRAGFTGGVMAEFTVPLIGVGADVSVLYVHRGAKYDVTSTTPSTTPATLSDGTLPTTTTTTKLSNDYIDIPLNLKYKIGLPVVSKFVAPFITTGPDFAFRVNKETVSDIYNLRKFDFSWNFGFGLEVMHRVQVAASYGLGLTKALQYVKPIEGGNANIEGKNRYWTVTAAVLF